MQGKCVEPLLQSWLAHPYLQRRPPKSLPRQLFGDEFAAQAVQQARQHGGSLHDLLCTATHFVARGVAAALQRFLPPAHRIERVFLSGGGVRNGLLWHLLEQQFGGDRRWSAPTRPASRPTCARRLAFGLLAALTLDGVPGNVPSATGAAGSRLLGSLTPGSSAESGARPELDARASFSAYVCRRLARLPGPKVFSQAGRRPSLPEGVTQRGQG